MSRIITPQYTLDNGTKCLLYVQPITGQPPLEHHIMWTLNECIVPVETDNDYLLFSNAVERDDSTLHNINIAWFAPALQTTVADFKVVPLANEDYYSKKAGEKDGFIPVGACFKHIDHDDFVYIYVCKETVQAETLQAGVPISRGINHFSNDRDKQHVYNSDDYEFLGIIDLNLLIPPRKISNATEFEAFLPNYTNWLSLLMATADDIPEKQRAVFWGLMDCDSSLKNETWFKREMVRTFAPGIFGSFRKQPAFVTEPFHKHFEMFPYMSTSSPGQLAYQPIDDGYRENDRQVRTKPGRFLNKFYDLTADQVRGAVSTINTEQPYQLKFAKTPEEFTKVYLSGPSSCMTHGIDWYDCSRSSKRLPISVLANGNIQVAYLELSSGIIPARALVVNDDKRYVEIYANNDAMDDAYNILRSYLEDIGYAKNGTCLIGEEIELLRTDQGDIVCPYIDYGGLMVDVLSNSLLITGEGCGERQPNYNTGTLADKGEDDNENEGLRYCDGCEEYENEDDFISTFDDGPRCSNCISDCYIDAYCSDNDCSRTGYVHQDDVVENESTGEQFFNYTPVLNLHEVQQCTATRQYFSLEDLRLCLLDQELYHMDRMTYIENEDAYVQRDQAVLANTGEYILKHTAIEIEGEYYRPDDDNIVRNEAGTYMLVDVQMPLSLNEVNAA
jgi:hypothetical protein